MTWDFGRHWRLSWRAVAGTGVGTTISRMERVGLEEADLEAVVADSEDSVAAASAAEELGEVSSLINNVSSRCGDRIGHRAFLEAPLPSKFAGRS